MVRIQDRSATAAALTFSCHPAEAHNVRNRREAFALTPVREIALEPRHIPRTIDINAPLNSTGAGRRAFSPAASSSAAAASSRLRLRSIFATRVTPCDCR